MEYNIESEHQQKSMLEKIRSAEPEAVLYYLGMLLIGVVTVFYFMIRLFGIRIPRVLTICYLHTLTGYYCPGCGGTRSASFLIHGHLWKSLYYNPFATYILIMGGIFMVTQTLSRLTGDRVKGLKFRNNYISIGVILLIIQFLIKNLLFGLYGIKLIP